MNFRSLFQGVFNLADGQTDISVECKARAESLGLIRFRPVLRECIWLWLYLFWRTDVVAREGKWWPVVGSLTDEDLAIDLAVSSATARRWRKRLEKAGLIRTVERKSRMRRIEFLNLAADLSMVAVDDQE